MSETLLTHPYSVTFSQQIFLAKIVGTTADGMDPWEHSTQQYIADETFKGNRGFYFHSNNDKDLRDKFAKENNKLFSVLESIIKCKAIFTSHQT